MKTSDQNVEMGKDVQECIRQEAKQGVKVMGHKFKSGDQDKKIIRPLG